VALPLRVAFGHAKSFQTILSNKQVSLLLQRAGRGYNFLLRSLGKKMAGVAGFISAIVALPLRVAYGHAKSFPTILSNKQVSLLLQRAGRRYNF